jgi:hypothetical protein
MLSLELLEANDVWLSFVEPSHEVFQPLVYVVDVESSDLHRSGLKPLRDCDLSERAGGKAKQQVTDFSSAFRTLVAIVGFTSFPLIVGLGKLLCLDASENHSAHPAFRAQQQRCFRGADNRKVDW